MMMALMPSLQDRRKWWRCILLLEKIANFAYVTKSDSDDDKRVWKEKCQCLEASILRGTGDNRAIVVGGAVETPEDDVTTGERPMNGGEQIGRECARERGMLLSEMKIDLWFICVYKWVGILNGYDDEHSIRIEIIALARWQCTGPAVAKGGVWDREAVDR